MSEETNSTVQNAPESQELTEVKKKRKKNRTIYNIILILLLGVVLSSAYQIISRMLAYRQADELYSNLESDMVRIADGPVFYPDLTTHAVIQPDTTGALPDASETLPESSESSQNPDTSLPASNESRPENASPVSGSESAAIPSENTSTRPDGSTYPISELEFETTPASTAPSGGGTQPAPTQAPVTVYPQPQGQMPWLDVNFPALLQRNSDVVGWLYGQDGQINLPLVQGRDNSYYLHRMLDGTWNYAGTLFVDYRNRFLEDDISFIYGHKMRNKTMFGKLDLYDSYEYYLAHPVLRLYTPTAVYELQIIASVYTDVQEPVNFNFFDKQDFDSAMQSYLRRAQYTTGVTAEYGDKLICLYTCAYQVDDGRRFMICKAVRIA